MVAALGAAVCTQGEEDDEDTKAKGDGTTKVRAKAKKKAGAKATEEAELVCRIMIVRSCCSDRAITMSVH